MRRTAVVLVSLLLLAGLVTGCGSSSSSSASSGSAASQPATTASGSSTGTTHFAKTKFLLHAGLAFGAFHRYIYKPFKTGAFGTAGRGRKVLIVAKGALAALFVEHELRLAAGDVQSSSLLRHLFSPFTALADRVRSLGSGLRGGSTSAAQVEQTNSQIGSLQSQSHASDVTPSSLAPVQ